MRGWVCCVVEECWRKRWERLGVLVGGGCWGEDAESLVLEGGFGGVIGMFGREMLGAVWADCEWESARGKVMENACGGGGGK